MPQPSTAPDFFDANFDVQMSPNLEGSNVAVTNGIHEVAYELLRDAGLNPLELSKQDTEEAFKQVLTDTYFGSGQGAHVAMGRGGFDKLMQKLLANDPSIIRAFKMQLAIRLGNGVGMSPVLTFQNGLIVERAPGGNAGAVRKYQDLGMAKMYDINLKGEKNPIAEEDAVIKNNPNNVGKYWWDSNEISSVANPEGLPADEMSDVANEAAEALAGKKVAIIGAGVIGKEVIKNSPFLKKANINVYDPYIKSVEAPAGTSNTPTMCADLEEALKGADLVILHNSGTEEVLNLDRMRMLAKGAKICNFARGKVVNAAALHECLTEYDSHLSGAVLDVHAVEGKDLLKFTDITGNQGDWEEGHYSRALRLNSKVVASNHSAANKVVAQKTNAQDGIIGIQQFMRGRVINPMNGPAIGIPTSPFVTDNDGHLSRRALNQQQAILQIMHDGKINGLLRRVFEKLRAAFGGNEFGEVATQLEGTWHKDDTGLNSIYSAVVDLPRNVDGPTDEVLAGIIKAAQCVNGVFRVRSGIVTEKTS